MNTKLQQRDSGLLLLCLILAGSPPAIADESGVQLADGPGRERVQAFCSACHSLDYIVMNSPFQDKAAWEKTVKKMVNVMGAPLTPEDVTAIVDYLDAQYGKQLMDDR
ncbi:MAG: cytochrome c [Steroidobacteraceae bacterium]